jgi:two-component system, OmpR family, response regulator VicR
MNPRPTLPNVAKPSVLLLEDDPNLGLILLEHLELNGFSVKLCVNGDDGLAAYGRGPFDLCLVDVMMPRRDGFSFAREVRRRDRQIPLMFLTARALKEDRIEGFKIGADDYITKPFSMEELLLRIQAVLKRGGNAPPEEQLPVQFTIGVFTFNHVTRKLTRGGTSRNLTAREADLLQLLCLRSNATLDRAEALKRIWGDDSYFNSRSMDVYVSRLRKYLKYDRRVEILNVHGRGVSLVIAPAIKGKPLPSETESTS